MRRNTVIKTRLIQFKPCEVRFHNAFALNFEYDNYVHLFIIIKNKYRLEKHYRLPELVWGQTLVCIYQ